MATIRQIAAMPIRERKDGTLEVLLVTSRETRRWVIPKGWPWPGRADHKSAAGEAWEEAGITGTPDSKRLGVYSYKKRCRDDEIDVEVSVYVLRVTDEHAKWPERKERKREWFAPADAAAAVAEPELKALIRGLATEKTKTKSKVKAKAR